MSFLLYLVLVLAYTSLRVGLNCLTERSKLPEGWSLQSCYTALFHQGMVIPLATLVLVRTEKLTRAISVIYASTSAYWMTDIPECLKNNNRVHILHHIAGLVIIIGVEMCSLEIRWWGAVTVIVVEAGAIGLSVVDIYPTPESRYGRLLLYTLSRVVMLYPMGKAFSLLPNRMVKTILALPVGLLLAHNYFVVRGLLVACRRDRSLDHQSVKLKARGGNSLGL